MFASCDSSFCYTITLAAGEAFRVSSIYLFIDIWFVNLSFRQTSVLIPCSVSSGAMTWNPPGIQTCATGKLTNTFKNCVDRLHNYRKRERTISTKLALSLFFSPLEYNNFPIFFRQTNYLMYPDNGFIIHLSFVSNTHILFRFITTSQPLIRIPA